MSHFTKNYNRVKKVLSSSLFTMTLLLLAIIVFLFNLNFEAFWIKAQVGQNIVGEGTIGYIPKWVVGTTTTLSGSATVTVNALPRKPTFQEN